MCPCLVGVRGHRGVERSRVRGGRRSPWGSEVTVCPLCPQLHSDMDAGDGGTRYTLEGEGVGSVFVVDGNTGNIHVTKSLDREEKEQYRLVATATDRRTGRALEPSSEFLIRVQDINDNAPAFARGSYVATVTEMADMGAFVHRSSFVIPVP